MSKIIIPQSYIDDGLIRVQTHPTLGYRIFNYTEHCQWSSAWDDITLSCRGLILDEDNNIVARPFPKFFNLDEPKPYNIPFHEPFEVTEKMDGSLIIIARYRDELIVATRGSFTSEQSTIAKEILNNKYEYILFPENTTYLLELVSYRNRIVCNYGDEEDLVLLGIIDNETGKEYAQLDDLGIPLVTAYSFNTYEEFKRAKLTQFT